MYKFNSLIATHKNVFERVWEDEVVKNEPMFFNSSVDYAYQNGGPITRNFLANLPIGWQHGVLDSRVHMLMEGWYPCVPGWHHDDVPRNGQPDYDNMSYKSEHLMGLVNGHIAPTLFALGECTMPKVENDIVYKIWHPLVDELVRSGDLILKAAVSGKYILFDWQTFHTGVKAVESGWRWFCRISRCTDRKPTNEIRKQVQVYLEYPFDGW